MPLRRVEGPPIAGLGRLAWGVVFSIVALYGTFFGGLILRQEAIPANDSAAYLMKTYNIADALAQRPLSGLDPRTYLRASPSSNAPLPMALAAIFLGRKARFQAVALLWLAMRLAALALALYWLAVSVGSARFVPAACLAILSGQNSLKLYPNLFLMDGMAEAFGLLAFAGVLLDHRERSWRSACRGAAAALAFILVKSGALAFLLPICSLHGLFSFEAWRRAFASGAAGRARNRRALLLWLAPYAVVAAIVAWLFVSPFGAAEEIHWRWLRKSHWKLDLTAMEWARLAWFILPPWLWFFLVPGCRYAKGRPLPRAAMVHAAALAVWWFFFVSVFISDDSRLYLMAMPVAATAVLMGACLGRRTALTATAAAAAVFGVSLARAAGFMGHPRVAGTLCPLLPWCPERQEPMPEIGLVPLAEDIRRAMRAARASDEGMIVAAEGFYVEPSAVGIAMRSVGGDPPIKVESAPWGSSAFDVHGALRRRWFLTVAKGKTLPLRGDVWVSLNALDRLLTRADSPLRPYLVKRFEDALRPPHGEDSATLWHLVKDPPAEALLAAARFVEGDFCCTDGQEPLQRQILHWKRVAESLPVDPLTPAAAEAIARDGPLESRGVRFGGKFLLVGAAMERTREGLTMRLAWESLRDQPLAYNVLVHMLDRSGKIASQADYPQDVLRGRVKKGMLWQDTIRVPREKLEGAERIGLGFYRGREMLFADRGPADLDGRRLLIGLSGSSAGPPAAGAQGCAQGLRDVVFGGDFDLVRLAMTRTPEGLTMRLHWKSLRGQPLDPSVLLHVLDSSWSIVSRADYSWDPRARVEKGKFWQDAVFIPKEKLKRAEWVGLSLRRGTEYLPADRGPTDLGRDRLLVRLPPGG